MKGHRVGGTGGKGQVHHIGVPHLAVPQAGTMDVGAGDDQHVARAVDADRGVHLLA